jgi:hypothetical protein
VTFEVSTDALGLAEWRGRLQARLYDDNGSSGQTLATLSFHVYE